MAVVGSLSIQPNNTSVLITWRAPFSFEFATVGPDITYCIEVTVTTQSHPTLQRSASRLVHSECDVEESTFLFAPIIPPSSCDAWEFAVTPVNLAGNGSTSSIHGGLTFTTDVVVNGNGNSAISRCNHYGMHDSNVPIGFVMMDKSWVILGT